MNGNITLLHQGHCSEFLCLFAIHFFLLFLFHFISITQIDVTF